MPGIHELFDYLTPVAGVAPQVPAGNATLTTGIVDMQGIESVLLTFQMGTWVTGAATITPAVLAGDVPNSFTNPTSISDEAAADPLCVLGSLAAITGTNGSGKAFKIGYRPQKGAGKRFVRFTLTIAGNSGNAPVSAMVLTKPYAQPAP